MGEATVTAFDCMTAEEYATWASEVTDRAVPCFDCPAWYEAEMRAEGRCDRRYGSGRPIIREGVSDRVRRQQRDAARRYRAARRERTA